MAAEKLATIYKRTSTGKVQHWTIEIDEDKYRTISGQLNGKSVTSEWTVCKGKNLGKANQTTACEQARKEAEAKRRLKLEGEYRESIDDVDKLEFKEPLLAKDWKDYKDSIKYPVYCQPKLDGVRCIVTKDGMFSRNGKPIVAAPHIKEALQPILDAHPDIEFDGELYNHRLKHDFDKIISLVRKSKPTEEDLVASADDVQYWIYDIRSEELKFSDRNVWICDAFDELSDKPRLQYVETQEANDEEELDTYYSEWLQDGFEGQMVRMNTPYEFKRSKNLLKRKEFIDEEFVILDIIEGEGNRSGMAGYMCFETKEGKPFKANMRGGVALYEEYLRNKHLYIGRKATVRYQNLTPDGIPRFPVVIAVRDEYE